ncbi:MAG: DUF4345 family protein [Bacteroidia bacterium]|nr:DUF4345 family protein [Bacteroidia bacterium]
MKIVFKIVVSLIGLFIFANGFLFMFSPESVMGHSQISANNAFGFSTIRGIIGGSMVATGLLSLWAIFKSKLELLHPVVIILLGWTLGRLLSLFMDGFDINVILGGIAISLFMAVVLSFAHKVLSKEIVEQAHVISQQ